MGSGNAISLGGRVGWVRETQLVWAGEWGGFGKRNWCGRESGVGGDSTIGVGGRVG